MRKILFRAKCEETGEWMYGYPLIDDADCGLKADGKCVCPHDGSEAGMYVWEDNFHEYNWFDVRADTIGQYTGLTDKNGVKIFEGDIIQAVDDRIYEVRIGKFRPGLMTKYLRDHYLFKTIDMCGVYAVTWDGKDVFLGTCMTVRVIGNVYDNPDLLA